MKRSNPWSMMLALSAALLCAHAHAQAPAGPNPQLDPPEVVQNMLAALKKNSDEGIAELYAFSSPGNKATVGPLAKFQVMIREGFPDMLGHREARLAPALIDGGRAMLPVEILGSDNEVHRYVFLLSRQAGPDCEGCWMADAVVSPEALEQQRAAPAYPT